MILKRWWAVVILAGGIGGIGFLGGSRFRPTYQAFVMIRLSAPAEAKIGGSGEGVAGVDPTEVVRKLKAALGTKQTLEPIIAKHAKLFTPKELAHRDALVAMFADVSIDRKTGELYQVTLRAKSPETAQKVVAELADKALELYRRDAEEQAIRFEAYARGQVEQSSEKLRRLENEMVDFLEKHPVMKLKSLDADPNAQEGDRLRTRRRSALTVSLERAGEKDPELKALLAKQQRLRTALKALTDAASGTTSTLSRELAEAKDAVATLKGQGLKDNHPLVKQAQKRVDDKKKELAQATAGGRTAASDALSRARDDLRQVTEEIRKRVQASVTAKEGAPAAKKEDVTALEAEWQRKRRSHTLLSEELTKREELLVNAALKKNLRIFQARQLASLVSPARMPEAPTGLTQTTIMVAAGVVGLLLGLAAAFLLGLLDVRLARPEHITRASDAFTILAVLVDHPLRRVEAALLRRQLQAGDGGNGGEPKQLMPPPGAQEGGVIHWLRGTDDLDQAISLLKTDTPAAGTTAQDSGWVDSAKTAFFDRNAPAPLGSASPGTAMVLASSGAALVQGARAPSPAGPPQPKIRVLATAPPYAPGLFVSVQPESKPAEQMRLLAGRLEAQIGKSLRVVAVSSWEQGVGKSTVAANLAMVLAESQKRVLAVDACPGGAALTRIFGIEPEGKGLCEQLQAWLDGKRGSTSPWELDQIAETLTICTSSSVLRPALPLLASEAFTRFVGDMVQLFDAVVIDTQALAVASDAVVLQRLVEGYVMVVARGQSTTRSLRAITTRIDPARILGFVFNEHRS
jgi:Mrp family chromosome partitioning ATPase/uncharacterized protein involved in exopolysaccharide biosynthesis